MKILFLLSFLLFTTVPVDAKLEGWATWYKCCNPITACGTKFNPQALEAAHKTLKCGTQITVTNVKNGKSVRVKITDRGPFNGNILDLTEGAARAIDPNYKKNGRIRITIK